MTRRVRRNRRCCAIASWAAILLLGLALPSSAAELAGVQMDDSIQVGGETLVLNGQGLRKKAIFKVYVAGLYLPQRQSDPQTILTTDTARRMVLQFVRTVDRESLSGAWEDCLRANRPGASASLRADFSRLSGYMQDVKKKDRMTFTYLPGQGTEVAVSGQSVGTVPGKEFADTLFGCWIGPTPPTEEFKEGVLGSL